MHVSIEDPSTWDYYNHVYIKVSQHGYDCVHVYVEDLAHVGSLVYMLLLKIP
jgi:hypothetical protein